MGTVEYAQAFCHNRQRRESGSSGDVASAFQAEELLALIFRLKPEATHAIDSQELSTLNRPVLLTFAVIGEAR
jgi:hypothetical protein